MRFAFLVHPLSEQTRTLLEWDRGNGFRRQLSGDLLSFCSYLHDQVTRRAALAHEAPRVRVVDELQRLVSITGAEAEGRLYEIPPDAEQILAEPALAMEYIEQATQMAVEWGAQVVGLGSMTGVVGGQGTYLAERTPIAVTTGNSLTVYTALRNLYRACAEAEVELSRETVAVVGIPGSIATAAAILLAPQCDKLLLVARRATTRAEQVAKELGGELVLDIPTALAQARVVLSATSTGNCIDQHQLRPGAIVIDVAVPTDVRGTTPLRSDVLIISGGLIGVPDSMPMDSMFLNFHHGTIPSCLAETMVLGLENRAECFSLGRNLDVDKVMEIGAIATEHGFDFARLYSFGLQLGPSALAQYRKANARRRQTAARRIGHGQSNGHTKGRKKGMARPATPLELAERASRLHERYINPVLIATGAKSGFAKTFVRGEGNYLWDADGRRYLDLVAGFGSLNLGHNHPRVAAALNSALAEHAPGFVQSAVNPFAATLAEQLVAITPSSLEMVFFANSGSEAVEAALKLARAASGRSGLLYCERSYHGKSLGALSVTGNPKYQEPFAPLVPQCEAVVYGELEVLERMLATRHFAAFIVEPIQAEGGMVVPPNGYLRRAAELCRATDTILIADEVQTGLGRTGRMFAVEHEGIEPDVMALAKSLGGGLMPIGAMLCRRDLWHKAYGSLQNFALHTSTFGGGSLACAAGLAALKALEEEDLIENARLRGQELYDGLVEVAKRSEVVSEIRGRGLLLGIEFKPLRDAFLPHWRQRFGMYQFLVPNFDALVQSIQALYVMQNLLQEFGIYTQVARSNPLVLRIQPPLAITPDEVRQVVAAVGQVCAEFDESNRMFDAILAKSTLGEHQRGKEAEVQLPPAAAAPESGPACSPVAEPAPAPQRLAPAE